MGILGTPGPDVDNREHACFDDGLAETEIPTGHDVPIVGSGPAGSAAALCLATLHVPNIMITEYRPTANTRGRTSPTRNLLGMPDIDIEITGTSLWGNNEMHATHLQKQRVFAAGDAVHRHPLSNGLSSHTSIQTPYNLA